MYSFTPISKNCLLSHLFIIFFCAPISYAQSTQDEKERLIKASQEYYLAKNNGLISPNFQLSTKKMYKYLNDGNVIVIQLRIQAAQAPLNVENPFEKLENDVKKRQGQPHPSENDLKFSLLCAFMAINPFFQKVYGINFQKIQSFSIQKSRCGVN